MRSVKALLAFLVLIFSGCCSAEAEARRIEAQTELEKARLDRLRYEKENPSTGSAQAPSKEKPKPPVVKPGWPDFLGPKLPKAAQPTEKKKKSLTPAQEKYLQALADSYGQVIEGKKKAFQKKLATERRRLKQHLSWQYSYQIRVREGRVWVTRCVFKSGGQALLEKKLEEFDKESEDRDLAFQKTLALMEARFALQLETLRKKWEQ